jgi:hypothetical protein
MMYLISHFKFVDAREVTPPRLPPISSHHTLKERRGNFELHLNVDDWLRDAR